MQDHCGSGAAEGPRSGTSQQPCLYPPTLLQRARSTMSMRCTMVHVPTRGTFIWVSPFLGRSRG